MASFVEQATLKVNDQSTKQIKQINAALKQLFATARRAKNIPVGVTLGRSQAQVRALTKDLANLSRRRPKITVSTAQAQQSIRALSAQIRALNRQNTSLTINPRRGPGGFSRGGGTVVGGGGSGNGRGSNNVFASRRQDTNWTAAGRIIARSFTAAVGFSAFQGAVRAGRSAREGITTLDTALANVRALGVDEGVVFEASRKAADSTLGVSQGDIVTAMSEQAASLTAQLKTGAISAEEFSKQMDVLAVRTARTAQILGTSRGNFATGGEDARQVEKALNLTGAGLDPVEKQQYVDAILNAIVASGGDMSGDEVKRLSQQLGSTFTRSLSPEGLARLILLRDEGGRQSTAEARTALQDLVRGNLNKKDTAKQIDRGLRDKDGRSIVGDKLFADPVGAAEFFRDRAIKAGVDVESSIAVADFLDNVEGFGTTGARLFAGLIPVIDQARNELEKFRATNSNTLLENPTLTATFSEINASFQDAIARQTQSLVPLANFAAEGVSNTIERLGNGALPTLTDIGGLLSAGFASSAVAFMDPATRPLGAAGLALSAAATSLTASAAALTTAAGIGAVADGVGGSGGGKGVLKTVAGAAVSVPGALVVGAGVALNAGMEREEGKELTAALYATANAFKSWWNGEPAISGGKGDRLPSTERFGGPMEDPKQAIFALDAMLAGGIVQMDNTFSGGVTEIDGAFSGGGSMASEAILNAIVAGGQQAAAAMGAAINNASVRVTPASAPNTGAMSPTE